MKSLNDIQKQNNFEVPEGYFEKLEKEVLKNIYSEKEKTTVFQILKPYIYMVACVALLVGGIQVFMENVLEKENIYSPVVKEEVLYEPDEILYYLFDNEVIFYEYIYEINTGDFEKDQINCEYIEDYLAQYYLEYELFDD
ncbi:MAG: hypothetical protein LBQ22_11100 [Bacteroidales bacterium]|jgi:hypothetical protein|nr:hypothetical protein [Bacteroidales bacterium]